MVDQLNNVMDATRRRITISYHIALTLVAMVVIAIAVITGRLVDDQISDASIINIAGRQRMLCERIALLTNELTQTQEQSRGPLLQELTTAVTNMENAHEFLLTDAVSFDILPGMQETVKALYFDNPMNLDAQVKSYIAAARKVLQIDAQNVSSVRPEVIELFRQVHGRLLDSLDATVSVYEQETIARFQVLYRIVLVLSLAALFTLLAIALLVFKPAIAFVEQAQRRIMELNQLKGDFLANMSHEIRTPMNGIFGMTELLFDSELNQRQQHYVRTLQNSADHLLGLINDILDFSKLEAGQMKLDPIRFNMLATVEDVMELMSARAREKNLELLLRYAPGTPRFIVADPGRIRQVLFNLLGNAIKFTDQGYVMVHVEMLPKDGAPDNRLWLRLRIEDTGIGIPEDKISGLFEKFMQVETGSTRARQGTGLGLAICRNIIKLMDGEIMVESRPGKGTVFALQIPLLEAGDPQPAIDRQTLLAGKRVLLVDDLAPNRLLYKEALMAAGMECLVAENAEEAISMLSYEQECSRPLHAVVTDYMMPVVDGLKLTRAIKSDPRNESLPVVILTSAGEQGLIKRLDEAGAAACLAKPVTRQQLFDTLAHVLDASANGEMQSIITAETSANLSARKLLTRERPLYGTHILLVEDNRINMEITTEMLNQFGCEVANAVTGREAIEATRKQAFDLIFMDCQMPEMDGFEAARHIVSLKAAGEIAPVPIVALTANALKGDRERCLESGMDDYLSKPMRKANLEAILLKWLRHRLEAAAKEGTQVATNEPEELPVIAAPSPSVQHPPSDYGVDEEAFAAARDMLGAKLPTILSYYLEDAQGYIDRIAESIQRHDTGGAIAPAHTLKSSSKQLGVTLLAELAARAEAMARAGKGTEEQELARLLPGMRDALSQVRPFFQSSAA